MQAPLLEQRLADSSRQPTRHASAARSVRLPSGTAHRGPARLDRM